MKRQWLLLVTLFPMLAYGYEGEHRKTSNRKTPSRARSAEIAQNDIDDSSDDMEMEDVDEDDDQEVATPQTQNPCAPIRVKKCRPRPRQCRPEPCCRDPKPCPIVVERPCCPSTDPCCPQPPDPCNNPIGFTIMGKYLFWAASEDNLEYALRGISPYFIGETQTDPASGFQLNGAVADPSPTKTGKVSRVPTKWKSGFRVGFGYDFTGSPWSIDLAWTWYQNSTHRDTYNTARPTSGTFSNPNNNIWPDSLYPQFGGNTADQLTARWKLRYNTLDLRWLRLINFGEDFSFNPHIGLRGAWINQNYNVQALQTQPQIPATNFYSSTALLVRMKNNCSGLGFRTGFDSAFHLGCGFSFYGNAALALVLSDFNVRDKAKITSLSTPTGNGSPYTYFNFREQFTCLKSQFDAALGFKWDKKFACDRYRIEIDLGYEYQLWTDQNQMTFKFPAVLPAITQYKPNGLFVREGGDLSLHGLTVGAGFSF